MKMVWKRALLGAAAIAFTGVTAGEIHAAHAGTRSSGPSQPDNALSTRAVKQQAMQLQHEISAMKQRLQKSETVDKSTVSRLTTLQAQAVALQR